MTFFIDGLICFAKCTICVCGAFCDLRKELTLKLERRGVKFLFGSIIFLSHKQKERKTLLIRETCESDACMRMKPFQVQISKISTVI